MKTERVCTMLPTQAFDLFIKGFHWKRNVSPAYSFLLLGDFQKRKGLFRPRKLRKYFHLLWNVGIDVEQEI